MPLRYFLLSFSTLLFTQIFAQDYTIQSPDATIQAIIQTGKQIHFQIIVDHKNVLENGTIAIEAQALKQKDWKVKSVKKSVIAETLTAIVPQKSLKIPDSCNQLSIQFQNGWQLQWRVYNNGIAWHWQGNGSKENIINTENIAFDLDKKGKTWYPEESEFFSHNEREYQVYSLDTMEKDKLASLPILFESQSIKLLLTETSLFHYPGLWLTSQGKNSFQSTFPHFPKKLREEGDRNEKVDERENYLARTKTLDSLPWRIVMIARKDKELLDNQLVYQNALPSVGDYSWVKPGKVQWDWWHYNNVYNVPFRAGVNNDTYKYYIDFAAKNHIEYIMLDEGWSDTRDLLKQTKDIDIQELVNYGKDKNVGVMLWMTWLAIDKQMNVAMDQFQKWGVKGIKVDFMQRDDQPMVEFYERTAIAAAKRQLLVDFHGAYKPTGWLRTFPNVMTSEGVYGNEQSKSSPTITPTHTTTIPYIRMAAGPMDFTPGSMNNITKGNFAAEPAEPMTPGTRANQMAMYVIFESPLQMLCDIPTHYIENPECMQFLSAVPSVWKNTIPIDGKVDEYTVMAREALNGDWYVGAMTDWNKRNIDLSFDFLPKGKKYKLTYWKDGPNADRNAKDYQMGTINVDQSSKMTLHLTEGGGFVARLIEI
ncbi:glycoside hydrolase family 97 protein [Rhizosphaericola mali]|uniref:Glycoside hydrolase family 97 protein n=1 Tax=Rhizosphaericola mali TaxID=2545455 RepID=A0A5P2G2V1_9BACT|nr:glycoside hydrolase family 97 protein [Rhizosphaericola mali]QES90144.1 glycoside hydrolase family 97 protein [Rhizosphaericola mali]